MGRPVQPAGLSDGVRQISGGPVGHRCQADEAWTEVLTLSPDAEIPGMREQFMCHWQYAGIRRTRQDQLESRAVATRGLHGRDGGRPLQPRWHRRTVLTVERPSREEVASVVDHTLLKPEATPADVTALGAEAAELGVYAVCVSPSMVAIAKSSVPKGMHIASVVGFLRQAPFGDQGRRGRAGRCRGRRRDRHGHRRRRRRVR